MVSNEKPIKTWEGETLFKRIIGGGITSTIAIGRRGAVTIRGPI